MSWTKAVTIWCDTEGCSEWHEGEGSNSIGDTSSVAVGRARGKRVGWAYRGGRDLCPEHAVTEGEVESR